MHYLYRIISIENEGIELFEIFTKILIGIPVE